MLSSLWRSDGKRPGKHKQFCSVFSMTWPTVERSLRFQRSLSWITQPTQLTPARVIIRDGECRLAEMGSLAERIKEARQRLNKVETRTVTADGRELVEKRSAEGRFIGTQVSLRPWGFVGDFKPDLQVAEILPNQLYMGSQDVAQDLSLLCSTGITHILNVATGIDNFFYSTFEYLKIEILDLPSANLKMYFHDCTRFMEGAMRDGGKVFVHCNAGVSSLQMTYLAGFAEWLMDCWEQMNLNSQKLKSMQATSCTPEKQDLVARFVTHTEKSISQFEENIDIPYLNVLFFVAGALSRSEQSLRRGCTSCAECLLEGTKAT